MWFEPYYFTIRVMYVLCRCGVMRYWSWRLRLVKKLVEVMVACGNYGSLVLTGSCDELADFSESVGIHTNVRVSEWECVT